MPLILLEVSSLRPRASGQGLLQHDFSSLTTGLASIPSPFAVEIRRPPQLEWMGLCDLGSWGPVPSGLGRLNETELWG